MVESSLEIKRWCFANVPSLGHSSRDSIIGHFEVDGVSRANDPESENDRAAGLWPVGYFISSLEEAKPETYVVQRDGTLSAIAARFGLALTDLAAWNGLADPSRIEVGQVIKLSAAALVPPVTTDEPGRPLPFQPPRVETAVVIDGQRLTLADGEYGGFSSGDNQDIYRRPVDFGSLGRGFVVVSVTRPPSAN
jgi:LysM repeat protein